MYLLKLHICLSIVDIHIYVANSHEEQDIYVMANII